MAAGLENINQSGLKVIDTLDRINRRNAEVKPVTGSTREERLSGQNAVDAGGLMVVQQKLQAGTLAETDRALVESLAAAARQNAELNASVSRMSAGAVSFAAQQSVAAQSDVARRALERLDGLSVGGPAMPAPIAAAAANAPKPAVSGGRTVTVKIDLGGGRSVSRDVAAGTENDVIAMLEDAGRAMGVR